MTNIHIVISKKRHIANPKIHKLASPSIFPYPPIYTKKFRSPRHNLGMGGWFWLWKVSFLVTSQILWVVPIKPIDWSIEYVKKSAQSSEQNIIKDWGCNSESPTVKDRDWKALIKIGWRMWSKLVFRTV